MSMFQQLAERLERAGYIIEMQYGEVSMTVDGYWLDLVEIFTTASSVDDAFHAIVDRIADVKRFMEQAKAGSDV